MLHFSILLALASSVTAWSPTDSYAPGIVECPSYIDEDDYNTDSYSGFVREANSISDSELEWMNKRDNITFDSLRLFLEDTDYPDFDTGDFMDRIFYNKSAQIPRIALAFSGGGYRALLCAAGEISGLDNRTVGTAEHGLPLLEATSYIAGLSGGSWFLSSLAYNNWTSVQEIVDQTGQDGAIWDFDHNILSPYGINIFKTGSYWDDIVDQIDDKRDAGFNVSLTDPWGRALSHQFFPGLDDYGASMTFTSIRDFPVFQNHSMPFPLVVSDGRKPGTYIIDANSTVFEFNPFELGSWDPFLNSFVDLKYAGTPMDAGKPSGNGSCWSGLDNTGFVFGSSSTLFNQFLLQLNSTGLDSAVYKVAHALLEDLSADENDISPWYPNPFYKSPYGTSSSIKDDDTLFLVDGGEDNQNVPLYPLLQKDREIDVIFAYDNSADTDLSWPNASSLVYTYQRQFTGASNNVSFPYVPGVDTFLHYNLTAKPTFFGCYASNLTDLMDDANTDYVPPLIIFNANRPFSYSSNTSTFKMSYDDDEKLGMIQNGFEVSTRKNLTLDADYKTCVACAILQRSKERLGVEIGDKCKECFDTYCWDGQTYVNENAVYPDSFTDTGMFNASSVKVDKHGNAEVNSSSSSADSTATAESQSSSSSVSVSSISSTSHNEGNAINASWLNYLSILLGTLAFAL